MVPKQPYAVSMQRLPRQKRFYREAFPSADANVSGGHMRQAIQPDPDQDLLEQLDRRERRSWFLVAGLALGTALVIGGGTFALMRYALGWHFEDALDVAMLIFAGAAMAFGLRIFSRH